MAKLGDTRHLPGKLIDTWTYKVKDIELDTMEWQEPEDGNHMKDERPSDEKYKRGKRRIKNKLVTVNVYMIKRTEQSEEAPHPLRDATLLVRCPELEIKIEGTDIVALKDAMWSMLDEKYEIKWERYYQVQVQKGYIHGDGTGMDIVYDDVYKGTTWDGKHLIKRWRGHEFKIDVWPGAFKDDNGKVMACIEATDENLTAVKEFCRRVDLLREKLAEFLKPDVIQQNLAQMASMALLPPVPKEIEEETDESSDAVTEAGDK